MVTTTESTTTPISAGGFTYNHDNDTDRADFAGFTADELTAIADDHGFDFSQHPAMNGTEPTYTAVIGTVGDVVEGDFCDVSIVENEITGHREGDNGEEIAEYGMTGQVVLGPIETDVRTVDAKDDENDDADDESGNADGDDVEAAADRILRANGWRRVADWGHTDNAAYARVERFQRV